MEELTMNPRGSKGLVAIVAAGALGIMLAAGGCAAKQERDQLRAEKQQLTGERQQLSEKVHSLESQTAEANATLEEVQKGLEDIRAKELKVVQSTIRVAQEGNAAGAQRERLQAEIQMLRDAVHKNLQKLAHLEKVNKANGVEMASLAKLSDELKRSLEEKATMITALESKVGDLSKTVETQATSLAEKDATIHENEAQIAQKTKDLNTAYVAVASKDTPEAEGCRREERLGRGARRPVDRDGQVRPGGLPRDRRHQGHGGRDPGAREKGACRDGAAEGELRDRGRRPELEDVEARRQGSLGVLEGRPVPGGDDRLIRQGNRNQPVGS